LQMRVAWNRRTVFDGQRRGSGDEFGRTRLDGDPPHGDGVVGDGRHGYALGIAPPRAVNGDEVHYCFWCRWKQGE
jgi:hypothetical protein